MIVSRLAAATTLLFTAQAHAQDSAATGTAFVAEFEKACVPGRLTYAGSIEAAGVAGWRPVTPDVHPELAAMMEMSATEALKAEEGLSDLSFDYQAFAKPFQDGELHLVVSRSSAVIGEPDDPLNPWVFLGCHLYDLDATAPIAPEPVTALIGNPVSQTEEQDGVITHVWGPPCPMPRTGDTYLSFVPEGGTDVVPFTGLALNFTTSELPAGEPVPDPYC